MAYTMAYTHHTATEEHPMNRTPTTAARLVATIVATIALLLGGTVALSAPASAEECTVVAGACVPEPCEPVAGICAPEPCVTVAGICPDDPRVAQLEQTANDYRVQVIALREQVAQHAARAAEQTARANRLQRVADRRAAKIQNLRAKIRALR